MPAKTDHAAGTAVTKPAVKKTNTTPKKTAKPKPPVTPKKPAPAQKLLTLKRKKNPKYLDRLYIPGMSEDVPDYDAGVAAWLFESGDSNLTIQVEKNWVAHPGDIITVGILINPTTVKPLAIKTLKPGEETLNFFFLAAKQEDLKDGEYALVYVVHYKGGADYDISYALTTYVKTDLPAGEDDDQIEDGHSGLQFSVSEWVIVPGNAENIKVTCQSYENQHPKDKIVLHWGQVVITQQVAGIVGPTVIEVPYKDIVEGGDSARYEVWFQPRDLVGNVSTPGSASVFVSVALDTSRPDGPSVVNAGPSGYIDLEVLAEKPLEMQVYTPANIGFKGDIYDVTCRFYLPKGVVKIVHEFAEITTAGRPRSVFFDYLDVRAAAGGRIDASFVLRRKTFPFEIFSKKVTAQVRGSVLRLASPHIEGYPDDHIADDPAYVIASIPYYAWRSAADKISLFLRYTRGIGDIVLHADTQPVGSSVPSGAPVKRVINREQLQLFKGLRPEFFYVISTSSTRARAVDLNESLRRRITIS